MGVQLSKISYNMSELEKKLGCSSSDEQTKIEEQPNSSSTENTANVSAASTVIHESPLIRTVKSNPHNSNSSLSSNGETSCVQLPWSRSTDKFGKRRKGPSKTSLNGSSEDGTSHSAKCSLTSKKPKRTFLRGIGGSKKKETGKTENIPSSSQAVTGGASPSSCVCTSYNRTNSDPQVPNQPVSGFSANGLGFVSLGPRFSSPHVLGAFNPDDYPIEDEDEKMIRQRAKEMAEGVEITDKFGLLSVCRRNSYQPAHSQVDYIHCLVPDLKEITSCSFYWGKIDRYVAEKLLEDKAEGTFLLRDSAQEEYLFSVSFRRYGRSLHARIEQWNHSFSFDAHDPSVFCAPTVTGLIEHYKEPSYCMFFEPMLTTRLFRNFTFSLQHLARSVICNHVTYDTVSLLPLPKQLKAYCREYHYKQRVRVRNFPE